jgi:membrane protein implicated in regulation of membrane protease activity
MYTANIVNDLFGDNSLNIVYAAALFIGVLYSGFLLFFQGIGDVLGDLDLDLDLDLDVDVDADFDADTTDAVGISMLAIASFITAFGGTGLVTAALGAAAVTSLIAALFGGFLMGIAAQVFFMYILSPTISSEVLQAKLIGQVAEITTPIPANGVGQIAFVAQGSRVTYSARSTSEGEAVIRGTPVRIERIVGGMAYVSRLD